MNTGTLESRNYVANEADIREMASAHREAATTMAVVPRNYLRAITAVTIVALGETPRVRLAKPSKLAEEQKTAQLAALTKTHDRFYAIVTEEEGKDVPAGKDRAQELNRRTNRYRTAYSAIRRWVEAGFDITSLAPAKVTKGALEKGLPKGAGTRRRPPSPARVRKRLESSSKVTMAAVIQLAEVDKAAAVEEINLLMGQLAGQLAELGAMPTKDLKTAVAEHRPLRMRGGSVFVPVTQTQVIRQLERPS
jgi:hypothetical protein